MSSEMSTPPGTSCPHRLASAFAGSGRGDQDEPRVDDVEAVAVRGRLHHVVDPEVDIAHARGRGLLLRQLERRLVEVDADHRPFSGHAREGERYVAAATADVEAPGRGSNTDAHEQVARRRRHHLGEDA
jgi:hypothetical protein